MLAVKTFNSNVSPNPDYLPLISTARMLLLKTNYVTRFYLYHHPLCLSVVVLKTSYSQREQVNENPFVLPAL